MNDPAPAGAKDTVYREELTHGDIAVIEDIVRSTGFFSDEETGIAVELAEERMVRGDKSGYFFIFAETGGEVAGYACYGPIPGTVSSFDLYWIAVRPGRQGNGLGSELLSRVEGLAAAMGCTRLYADTSTREQYGPTRAFYLRSAYREAAVLEDFYAPGDGKVIYEKIIG
ncbi:MAG TPA: GNAT family N-acetyltransferase [Spirochaetes bacterium]|nr:GNAT family N-acetyltransferase [Spirochaetota bacterium]